MRTYYYPQYVDQVDGWVERLDSSGMNDDDDDGVWYFVLAVWHGIVVLLLCACVGQLVGHGAGMAGVAWLAAGCFLCCLPASIPALYHCTTTWWDVRWDRRVWRRHGRACVAGDRRDGRHDVGMAWRGVARGVAAA